MEEGYIHALAPKGLTGAKVVFPKVSVGATEDLLMAACLASGDTQLMNAARETEVTDLGECLMKMGRSEERRGGQEWVSTSRSRRRRNHKKRRVEHIEEHTYI